MDLYDKIAGIIYGQALGDAFGMPAELWTRQKSQQYFGGYVRKLLDGPSCNNVARYYKKGQYTDDTAQALVLLDSLKSTGYKPDPKDIALRLLAWADENDAWKRNILGPTSRAALLNVKNGITEHFVQDSALSNGSAMRISPIGGMFLPDDYKALAEYVFDVSKATHSSCVAVSCAAMIAEAVSSAVVNSDMERVVEDALRIEPAAFDLGCQIVTARPSKRTEIALDIAVKYKGDDEAFMQNISDTVGTGTNIIESVPAALAIAYYSRNPNKACYISANIGGDTDTIGAMATAICAAFCGFGSIKKEYIGILKEANNTDFDRYVEIVLEGRNRN